MKIYLLAGFLLFSLVAAGQPGRYFKIRITDSSTGRGVPLVELKTTNKVAYITDNNGIIAFLEPGLMNQEVWFHIRSHGYEYPADVFGYRGKKLFTKPGDSAVIAIRRVNVAERLYRVTGEGLYDASILTGDAIPLQQPVLNGKVTGQDTFIETLYRGRMYWFWGDTDRPSYPLGNFATSGATSLPPGKGGLDPSRGVDLTYFTDATGFSKKMCPLPDPGLVWIHWLTTLPDHTGRMRLVTSWCRVKNLGENYEQGLAIFNDSAEIFEPVARMKANSPIFPDGHSFRVNNQGNEYIYFEGLGAQPLRVRADLDSVMNLSSYESFTFLKPGTGFDSLQTSVDRGPDGRLNWGWKRYTGPLNSKKEQWLLEKRMIHPDETFTSLVDFVSGGPVVTQFGSVCWNNYRQKWIMVVSQILGTSYLGEVWYAEADTPTGPWVYARKIVTHEQYSFYNPGQHPLFDQENGRLVYFEGTYCETFSGSPQVTPKYDYNQVMYRLSLDDPRLFLPAPVYRFTAGKQLWAYGLIDCIRGKASVPVIREIPFMALPPDRILPGTVPVYASEIHGNTLLTTLVPRGKSGIKPLFYALPASSSPDSHPKGIDGRWECRADDLEFIFELKSNGTRVTGSINQESLVITSGSLGQDSLILRLTETSDKKDYMIRVKVSNGRLDGSFAGIGFPESGHFTGSLIVPKAPEYQSAAVVPLYEFSDAGGHVCYSVRTEIAGWTRGLSPLCKVWKNPSGITRHDFASKPVPVGETPVR